jgi:hypothetical protein
VLTAKARASIGTMFDSWEATVQPRSSAIVRTCASVRHRGAQHWRMPGAVHSRLNRMEVKRVHSSERPTGADQLIAGQLGSGQAHRAPGER